MKSIPVKDLRDGMRVREYGYISFIDMKICGDARDVENDPPGYTGWLAIGEPVEGGRPITLFVAHDSGGAYAPDLYLLEGEGE